MYYPYFRGKQYDLIAIRECAALMAKSGFVPIIEPVKESISALTRTLQTLEENQCPVVLIVNPKNGDHSTDSSLINNLLTNAPANSINNIRVGIILNQDMTTQDALKISQIHKDRAITFIHEGFNDPSTLARSVEDESDRYEHVFFDDNHHSRKLYRKHFNKSKRVLIRDGFKKQPNKNYPDVEFFSELHETFDDEGMDGFGDFLIVGDDYSESGGPAWAVAIHITYIDYQEDKVMHIHHFKSIQNDTPTNPGGKFAEALEKLVKEVENPNTKIITTDGIKEFQALHKSGHFPGLGTVKKLCMKHHIETIANYFSH